MGGMFTRLRIDDAGEKLQVDRTKIDGYIRGVMWPASAEQ